MVDKSGGGTHPATEGEHVIPSDSNGLSSTCRALWVGGAGAIRVLLVGGNDLTFSGVTAGTLLPLRATKVFSTGTTATLIVAVH